MKIVLTTTIIVAALLAIIGIVGINNSNNGINIVYAQEGAITPEGMNDTMSMGNNTGMMMGMENDDDMMMNFNGTIDVEKTMAEAFKSKITTDIIGAIQAAQASVGPNSFVKEAELTPAHGFLVYKVKVIDENLKKYKVIVDPGNGQVLLKKEITWCDENYDHGKMKYGGHDKYDSKMS
jgi:uncharacterized membrane protein YkoI